MTFHATVFYRTATACRAFRVVVVADDHETARERVLVAFKRRRPRSTKIDQIDIVKGDK